MHPPITATVPPTGLTDDEKRRLRSAAFHATVRYPGPVGDILSQHLRDFEEFGYRFSSTSGTRRLVEELLRDPA